MGSHLITDPTDQAQLSLDYLQRCLIRAGKLPNSNQIASFTIQPLEAKNSTVYKISLQYQNAGTGLPNSLILKLCQGPFGSSEVHYYTRDYAGLADAPIPYCYDAVYEHSGYHLLLEDLSSTHQNGWEVQPTLEYGQACARAAAKLHSYYWGTRHKQDPGYASMSSDQIHRYLSYMQQGLAPILQALPESEYEEYRSMIQQVFHDLPKAMLRRQETFPDQGTLVHGDLNPGNILSSKATDKEIYLIDRQPFDWSLTSWLGPSDLSYMMVLWWEPALRRQYETAVLKAYYEQLVQLGVTDYSWELLLLDYKLSAMQCFFVAAQWCIQEQERIEMRWLWFRELERTAEAYRDLNGPALLKN
ncbi:hypothetical protein DCC85_01310 [Paenibacillus sp. CAA11]|uniref:phosphotransferase family protein n=1 Tax=Paenibacillus sp. CAA11 TaxID=1532905 RepID=UPI000D3C9C51|nr:phosphotransferase [Paenibacillus sp. CAA11]AWB43002.1 hypothetical protein DCC85_01310 [Paenibacillus sp. CAA11]